MALDGITTQENSEIFMPALYNGTWHFDAMGWFELLGDRTEAVVIDYWDEVRKTRMTEAVGGGQEYAVHVVNHNYEFMLDDNQHGYYLYNDIVGADIAETICSLF